MSRGKSTRLVATAPRRYSKDFEKILDKRSMFYRAWKAKVAAILADRGGAEELSRNERFLVMGQACDELVIEAGMADFINKGTVNYGLYSQARFSWLGTVDKLGGVKRRSRDMGSVRERIANRKTATPPTVIDNGEAA